MTLPIGQNHFEGPELNDELERFGDWRRRRRKSYFEVLLRLGIEPGPPAWQARAMTTIPLKLLYQGRIIFVYL